MVEMNNSVLAFQILAIMQAFRIMVISLANTSIANVLYRGVGVVMFVALKETLD